METNKKFIISLTSVAVVAVAAIVSLVVVLAAFSVTATSGFKITYTSYSADATITGTYKVATTAGTGSAQAFTTADSTNKLVFTKEDQGTVSKAFENVDNIGFGVGQIVVLEYVIKNDSTVNAMTVALASIPTVENMAITYAYNAGSALSTTTTSTIAEASFTQQTIAQGATGYVYIAFAVAEDVEVDVVLNGTATFTLTAVAGA